MATVAAETRDGRDLVAICKQAIDRLREGGEDPADMMLLVLDIPPIIDPPSRIRLMVEFGCDVRWIDRHGKSLDERWRRIGEHVLDAWERRSAWRR
jgi:hypothetical protein